MLSYSAPFADYSFSYDARNRQTQAYVGAIATRWLINGLGQRIAQINVSVPAFFFVYDEAGHLSGKYDGGGNPVWETAWLGDLPVAPLTPPAGRFYIAPDHLGSPHLITAAGGALAWLWTHDPFGNGDALGGPYDLRFPGQYFDQATKLHYNYFRDYDPRLGRYIESDPVGLAGGINTYAYAGGNPIKYSDPLGLTDPNGEGSLSQSIGKFIDSLLPCEPDEKCKQLVDAINAMAADLQKQYNDILYNPLNLPPTGKMSVEGHQKQFRQDQGRLRKLLNEAATNGCTGYDPDAWKWATVPTPSPI